MDDGLRSHALHVALPGIVRIPKDDDVVCLYHPGHGTSLDVTPESQELVDAALAGFATPRPPRDFQRAQPDVPRDLLVMLVREGFIVEQDELPFLEQGFLRPAACPLGPAIGWSELRDVAATDAWVTVGVPADLGALATGGARHGPAEIRKVMNGSLITGEGDVVDYELRRLYRAPAPRVADLGDVEPDGGRLDHVGARLRKVVREVLACGMRPLLLGGDHSLTHFALAEAVARGEPFGILHFDAHADLGPSRVLSHANVFGAALESPLVMGLVQIGLRGIERMSPFSKAHESQKRVVVTAREARAGVAMQVLEALPKDLPYYLSFDVDCIDAAVARETGTPLFGGLSFELATDLIDYVARHFRLLGADFVEVSGPPSFANAAALISASLVQRCLLADQPFEALPSHVYKL
jgi:arginase family enzyme